MPIHAEAKRTRLTGLAVAASMILSGCLTVESAKKAFQEKTQFITRLFSVEELEKENPGFQVIKIIPGNNPYSQADSTRGWVVILRKKF